MMKSRKKGKKRIFTMLLILILCFIVVGCGKNEKEQETAETQTQQKEEKNTEEMLSNETSSETNSGKLEDKTSSKEVTPIEEDSKKETSGEQDSNKQNTQETNDFESAQKETQTSTEKAAKGRYLETTKSLEEWIGEEHSDESLMSVVEEGNKIILYTSKEDGSEAAKYELVDGQKAVRSIPGWLNPAKPGFPRVFRGQDGKLYAIRYVNNKMELIVSESEEKSKKVSLGSNQVMDVAVLKNGDIIASVNGMNDLVLYSRSTGKEKCRYPGGQSFTAVEDYIVIANDEGTSLTVYNTTGEKVHSIAIEGALNSSILVQGHESDIYMVTQNGIFRTGINGTIWEQLVDGNLNTISRSSNSFIRLFITKAQDFYLIMNVKWSGIMRPIETKNVLYRYTYDTSVYSVPQQQLVIYGLKENSTIRQAAAGFQAKHPEVMISYLAAEANFGMVTTEDNIRTLNMELMGGKGPDILILDGLPAEQYIEKGILYPLDSLLEQVGEELLPNVVKTLQTETGSYAVPLKLNLPLVLYGKGMENYASSLKQLVNYSKEKQGTVISAFEDEKELIHLYDIYGISLLEDGTVKKEELTEFLENIKAINDSQNANNLEHFKDKKHAAYLLGSNFIFILTQNLTGFESLQRPFSAVKQAEGGYLQLTKNVTANATLAINAASSQIELAEQFIQECLSYEVQKYDLDDGFPVNQKAMNVLKNQRTPDSMAMDFKIKGEEYYFSFGDIGFETTQEIVHLLETLPVRLKTTDAFLNIMYSEAIPYLKGEKTLDETVQSITSKAQLLLME